MVVAEGLFEEAADKVIGTRLDDHGAFVIPLPDGKPDPIGTRFRNMDSLEVGLPPLQCVDGRVRFVSKGSGGCGSRGLELDDEFVRSCLVADDAHEAPGVAYLFDLTERMQEVSIQIALAEFVLGL